MRIVLMSSQTNREERIAQTVDPRSLVTIQPHNLLTLDHTLWNKIVITWPSIDRNWANSQFRQLRLLRYSQMTARLDLINWQFYLLSTTISSYQHTWMMHCVSTVDLTSLPHMTLRLYHTNFIVHVPTLWPYVFTTQKSPQMYVLSRIWLNTHICREKKELIIGAKHQLLFFKPFSE